MNAVGQTLSIQGYAFILIHVYYEMQTLWLNLTKAITLEVRGMDPCILQYAVAFVQMIQYVFRVVRLIPPFDKALHENPPRSRLYSDFQKRNRSDRKRR